MIPTIHLNNEPMPYDNDSGPSSRRPTAVSSATPSLDSRTVYHSLGRRHHIGNATVPVRGSIHQAGLTSASTVPQQMKRSHTLNGFLAVPPKPFILRAFYPAIFLEHSRYAASNWGPVQHRSAAAGTGQVAQPAPQRPANRGLPIASLQVIFHHMVRNEATEDFIRHFTEINAEFEERGIHITHVHHPPFPRLPSPLANQLNELHESRADNDFNDDSADNDILALSDEETAVDNETDTTLNNSSVNWGSESGYEGEAEREEGGIDWEIGWTLSSEGSLSGSQVLSDLEDLPPTSVPADSTNASGEDSSDVEIVDIERYSPLPYYLREPAPPPRRRESSLSG